MAQFKAGTLLSWLSSLEQKEEAWLTIFSAGPSLTSAGVACQKSTDSLGRRTKDMTLEVFCGDFGPALGQRHKAHDHDMMQLATPAISPFLDLWPVLQGLPACFSSHRKAAEQFYSTTQGYWTWLNNQVLQRHASETEQDIDTSSPSIVSKLHSTEAFARHGFTAEEAITVMGTQLGSNQTVNVAMSISESFNKLTVTCKPNMMLQIFLAIMMSHPEVWQKAQKEMDVVIGRDRFPTAEDECRLPYLRAVQYECQRFRPVVPLSW